VSERTTAQTREILDAVMAERARCAIALEKLIARLGLEARRAPPGEAVTYERLLALLEERADRIRRPWRVREAERKAQIPGRFRKCCGLCGGEDHRAQRCPGRKEAA